MTVYSAGLSEPMSEEGLTIDEVAALAQVPSRTIRFYQARGALMAPEIRGRVAYYSEKHIERLRLIASLQDRGLSIAAIRDLLGSIDKGETDLAEWLGVENALKTPWADDQPRTLTEAELYTLAGTKRPGLIADLTRAKLLERRGDVLLLVSPALLGVAMKLEAAGIDMETAVKAADVLRKSMAKLSTELVDLFVKRVQEGAIEAPTDAASVFQALRPAGLEAVRVVFGREMEKSLRKLLESGKLATLPAKVRRRRR